MCAETGGTQDKLCCKNSSQKKGGDGMKRTVMAICAPDPKYCERLAEYFGRHRTDRADIRVFCDRKRFQEENEKGIFQTVLLEESFFPEEQNSETRYILLNEGRISEDWKDFPTIFQFQSADHLLRELFSMTTEFEENSIYTGGKELIGVYSPHQHDLQMAFSLGLAEVLSEKRRVLYLNFMDCAGFGSLLGEEYQGDLGDLLYYVKTGQERLSGRLSGMIYQLGRISYIPPAVNPENLHEADREDYERLLRFLTDKTDYETIVLDFGAMLPGFGELLARCDRILCPVRECEITGGRVREFQRYLSLEHSDTLQERTKFVSLSDTCRVSETLLDAKTRIFSGESGENLLREILDQGGADGA